MGLLNNDNHEALNNIIDIGKLKSVKSYFKGKIKGEDYNNADLNRLIKKSRKNGKNNIAKHLETLKKSVESPSGNLTPFQHNEGGGSVNPSGVKNNNSPNTNNTNMNLGTIQMGFGSVTKGKPPLYPSQSPKTPQYFRRNNESSRGPSRVMNTGARYGSTTPVSVQRKRQSNTPTTSIIGAPFKRTRIINAVDPKILEMLNNLKNVNYNNSETIYSKFEKFVKKNPLPYNLFRDGSKLILTGGKATEYQFKPYNNRIKKGSDYDFSLFYPYLETMNKRQFKVENIRKRLQKTHQFFGGYVNHFIKKINDSSNKKYIIQHKFNAKNINYHDFQNETVKRKHIGTLSYDLILDGNNKEPIDLIDIGLSLQRSVDHHDIDKEMSESIGFPLFKKDVIFLTWLAYAIQVINKNKIKNEKFTKIMNNLKIMLSIYNNKCLYKEKFTTSDINSAKRNGKFISCMEIPESVHEFVKKSRNNLKKNNSKEMINKLVKHVQKILYKEKYVITLPENSEFKNENWEKTWSELERTSRVIENLKNTLNKQLKEGKINQGTYNKQMSKIQQQSKIKGKEKFFPAMYKKYNAEFEKMLLLTIKLELGLITKKFYNECKRKNPYAQIRNINFEESINKKVKKYLKDTGFNKNLFHMRKWSLANRKNKYNRLEKIIKRRNINIENEARAAMKYAKPL